MLYKTTDYLGQKKTVNLNYDKGMKVECFKLTPQEEGEPAEELLVTYDLDEVEKYATNEIALKANSTVPKVSLSFELSRSQFIKLKQVQVKIDETVVEEIVPPETDKTVPPEPQKPEKEVEPEKPEEAATNETQETNEPKKKVEIDPEWDGRQMEVPTEEEEHMEPAQDEEQAAEEPAEEQPAEVEKVREYKTTIKPHTFEVKVVEKLNNVRTLDAEQVKASKRRIKSLEKRDENLQAKH